MENRLHVLVSSYFQLLCTSQPQSNVSIGHQLPSELLKITSFHLKNKSKIHLIINLNYAITEDEKTIYKKELNDALKKLNCSYVILRL